MGEGLAVAQEGETMTDDEIKAGLALCEAATEGPWEWERHDDSMDSLAGPHDVLSVMKCDSCVGSERRCYKPDPDDAEFIARARTDLPRALAVVEAADRLAVLIDDYVGEDHDHDRDECDKCEALYVALAAYRKVRG